MNVGAFLIDPLSPRLDGQHKESHKSRKKALPDASYHSRKGNITVDLATAGSAVQCPKASVAVSTRSGDILVNLVMSFFCWLMMTDSSTTKLPTSKSKPCMALEIKTRRGKTSPFVWPTALTFALNRKCCAVHSRYVHGRAPSIHPERRYEYIAWFIPNHQSFEIDRQGDVIDGRGDK